VNNALVYIKEQEKCEDGEEEAPDMGTHNTKPIKRGELTEGLMG
jgi:hypothetical protein